MALADAKPTTEKEVESQRQTKWFPFFKDSDNTYINDLALRAKRSPTHGAILQSKAIYTAGDGFSYSSNNNKIEEDKLPKELTDYLKEINGDRDSLHWLFSKVGYDFVYSGNAYVEVKKGEFTSLFYQDATKVRVNDTKAFISAYWRDIKNDPSPTSDYPIETIDLWDGNLETTQKHFIIHLKNDTPEYDYYGLPESVQALNWADIEYKIPRFNLDLFKNGFFPSVALDMFGQAPDGMSDQDYVQKIVDKFTDEGNNSKIFAQLLDDPTQSTKITEFSTTRDGQFTELDELATKNIISSHRWFASLAGISTAGALGSNQQIRNEYNIALKSLVIPQFQTPLLRLFNDLLKIAGFSEITLGILNVAPVGIEDQIDPKAILSVNEQRELLGYEPIEENELKEKEDGSNDSDDNSK
jgi:hypothetical protein